MKLLLTGCNGYIGSVLSQELLQQNFHVTGLDAGFYNDNLFGLPENYKVIKKDIRDIILEDVKGYHFVVHLAALSNDPLGELSPGITQQINCLGTLNLAKMCKEAGVKRFIFISSQSIYGYSQTTNELDEYKSKIGPTTAYAISKWEAEKGLRQLISNDFVCCSFRPATVFGSSPRIRSDIVFNNFVGCAFTTGKIEILSDGNPWRPVVHIKDVCQAVIAGLRAPAEIVQGQSYNIGIKNGNYTGFRNILVQIC